jgi:H/ACA ribonucleoprotein complex subunit 4
LFKAGTQAGTYIRKLCHDMGLALKTDEGNPSGAHMAELRRTKAGPFNETMAVTLQDVTDAFHYYTSGDPRMLNEIVLPVERGVAHLKKLWVLDSAVDPICNGVRLKVPGIAKLHDNIEPGDMVAVMTLKDELVLVGRAALDSQAMLGGKGVAVVTEQVFMPSGTYPKNE